MDITLLIFSSILLLGLGAFAGALWGFRVGVRDGRRSAEMARREHWVDLLETSISVTRSRAAHPSRGDRAEVDLTGRQES
jgi:hypothetical protein